MPRGPRIQFPHACYHVINRGNYRRDIFATAREKLAFEQCLLAACERMGWVLYAYVVMRNHFHLALCTPQGNLARGMQWLETTFATRFNRGRDGRGRAVRRALASFSATRETGCLPASCLRRQASISSAAASSSVIGYSRRNSVKWISS
jgi:REP element-mobilizing transposase RayT